MYIRTKPDKHLTRNIRHGLAHARSKEPAKLHKSTVEGRILVATMSAKETRSAIRAFTKGPSQTQGRPFELLHIPLCIHFGNKTIQLWYLPSKCALNSEFVSVALNGSNNCRITVFSILCESRLTPTEGNNGENVLGFTLNTLVVCGTINSAKYGPQRPPAIGGFGPFFI
ncbi:hypothetical protein T265_03729 [Opisthorchis viverrini]|uniref:Uncharacterized protein n=1 Tax=Opisthorchis viverrini TaxID=6198 RepID=A0A074ZV55_OPIVI|nr:hypothetical protein T265_03729 [Opisthorchis viverrini]KER29712.1 hypothetical protein T265_03729 [Opisthorchis viverrini]